MARERRRLTAWERLTLWISRGIVWVMILFALFPMYFVFKASVSSGVSFFSSSPFDFHGITFHNYWELFHPAYGQTGFVTWMQNSLLIGGSVAVLQLFFTATSAYAVSRMRFVGRKYGLMTMLLLQMFPNTMAITAIYTALAQMKLLDNLPAYALVLAAGSAFNIWLLKGYFDTLPRELDEAAIMDGAGHFSIFWRIILPLSKPMLVVIFLFTIIGTFGDYVIGSMLVQSPTNYTLALGMQQLISQQFSQNWTEFAAAAILSALPLTILYMVFQKWIATGLVAGSVKG